MQANYIAQASLIDEKATAETQSLYFNLKELSKNHLLYGHQDDIVSDVKKTCGSYPAVFGWELGNLDNNLKNDSIIYNEIQVGMIKIYQMGGVNTLSWHLNNPVSLKNSWDVTKAVYSILPGGQHHNYFKNQLKMFAAFNMQLVDSNGIHVPLIFRTWNEQNGNWYWWGKKLCSIDEYKDLFKFTVTYLRDSLNVHNLIYVYSPDGQFEDYMERYPGDEYVDLMGFDYYFRNKIDNKEIKIFTKKLIDLNQLAFNRNKLAVLSEVGYNSSIDPLWHTKVILQSIKENKMKIKLGYFLFWSNLNNKDRCIPDPCHFSASDFDQIRRDSMLVFLDNLPDMYSRYRK